MPTATPRRVDRELAAVRERLAEANREKWQVTYDGPEYRRLQGEIDRLSARKAELEEAAPVVHAQTAGSALYTGGALVLTGAAAITIGALGWVTGWFIAIGIVLVVLGLLAAAR